jgi:hypothetical protein
MERSLRKGAIGRLSRVDELLRSGIDNDQAAIISIEMLQDSLGNNDMAAAELDKVQKMIYQNAAILQEARKALNNSRSVRPAQRNAGN